MCSVFVQPSITLKVLCVYYRPNWYRDAVLFLSADSITALPVTVA
jgi:hypothetical protein